MKLISIGFGSTVCAERVLAVIAPELLRTSPPTEYVTVEFSFTRQSLICR